MYVDLGGLLFKEKQVIRLLTRVSRILFRSYYAPASVWMIYNLKAESVESLNTPMKLVGE
jgi:hypothetical protein